MPEKPVGGPANTNDDRTAFERALEARRRGAPIPPLDPDLQQLVDDLVPWLEALRSAAAELADEPTGPLLDEGHQQSPPEPVRADDPVALMLGLVADPTVAIDGRKLTMARKKAGLDLKDLVRSLRYRGWTVDTKEVFRWQTGNTSLSPALTRAIARELHVDESSLLAHPRDRQTADDLFNDARITAFLAEWSRELRIAPTELRHQLTGLLVGANRRNSTTGSPDALLAVLKTLRSIPDFLDNP